MESSVKYLFALSIFHNYFEINLPQVPSNSKEAVNDKSLANQLHWSNCTNPKSKAEKCSADFSENSHAPQIIEVTLA